MPDSVVITASAKQRSVTSNEAHRAMPLVCPKATIAVTGSKRAKFFADVFESQFTSNTNPDFADINAKGRAGEGVSLFFDSSVPREWSPHYHLG